LLIVTVPGVATTLATELLNLICIEFAVTLAVELPDDTDTGVMVVLTVELLKAIEAGLITALAVELLSLICVELATTLAAVLPDTMDVEVIVVLTVELLNTNCEEFAKTLTVELPITTLAATDAEF
jgi:hypothetical protein